MYSRLTQCTLKPQHINDVRQALDTAILPSIRKQPGFVDAIESINPDTGQFVCLTVWKSREDADRYGNTLFPELSNQLRPLTHNDINVTSGEVQSSTVHKIASGKAA